MSDCVNAFVPRTSTLAVRRKEGSLQVGATSRWKCRSANEDLSTNQPD